MRIRWHRHFRQCYINILAVCVVTVKACQKLSWRVGALVSLCLVLVWWMRGGDNLLCDGHDVQEEICRQFANRDISGNICVDLCLIKSYQLSGCGSYDRDEVVKTFQVLHDGRYLRDTTAVVHILVPDLRHGLNMREFSAMLSAVLVHQLDKTSELDVLIKHLMNDFDFNRDAKLSYGEAQTLWKQLHQPRFLNNYMFQSTGAVPRRNGTCGPLSVWYHGGSWSHFYNPQALWPISLIYNKAYRMTLPSWPQRAKVVLSLLELVESLIEVFGARFHLCNISGESLFYNKNKEVRISDHTQLLSSQQIEVSLSNRTCHHDHDCFLSHQCQTKCHSLSRTCTGQLVRPTMVYICDIIQDYLAFDSPKSLRNKLGRQVRHCRDLWSFSSNFHVTHSIIILDLKTTLWRFIQDMNL